MSRSRFLNNTAFRFIFAIIAVVLVMHMLKTGWRGKDKVQAPISSGGQRKDRLVVAHFMVSNLCASVSVTLTRMQLGNTYPYTEEDWRTSLHLAEETGL